MKRAPFVRQNLERWEAFEQTLAALEKPARKRKGVPGLADFPRQYRRLCRDYGLAQHRSYGERLTGRLNRIALRGYRQLYRAETPVLSRIIQFIARDFPALVRREQRSVWLSLALFGVPFLTMWIGCIYQPHWIHYVASVEQMEQFGEMYDPANQRIGRPSGGDAKMFGFYIRNNVGIAFRTFAGGLLLGIGAIFFLVFNGFFIGAIFGYVTKSGFHETLYPFAIGHGSFELTAIVLAGAAGLKLGAALVAPGRRTRAAALIENGRVCIGLMWGVFSMLVAAAFLEAFWSPSSAPSAVKYAVGGLLWIAVIAYFLLAGRRRAA